jgi:hypothetical protein
MRLIYIAAHSRSGSTLLARMLGQQDSWISVGETRYLWRRGMVENQPCGCGAPFRSCPFWAAVVRESFGEVSIPTARHMADSIRAADRLWRVGSIAPGSRRAALPSASEALDLLGALYRGIAKVSGATVVVDSSKSPGYARLVGRLPEVRLELLHLVRDCRGVAFSRIRRVRRGELRARSENWLVARTALEWGTVNELSRRLGALYPYFLLRYEDLVRDPLGALGRIRSEWQLPVQELPFLDGSRVCLNGDHTVSGNQMRFNSGWIPLQLDEEWKQTLTRGQRAILRVIGRPWLARYGYL